MECSIPSQLLPLQVLSPQGRPLPDILNHSFLYVLHDGVKAFLVSHPAAIEKVLCKNTSSSCIFNSIINILFEIVHHLHCCQMTREDLVKMIAGLRTLILKAALLSPQFTSRDVQVSKLDCLTYVHTCYYMLLNSRSYHAIPPSESNDSLFANLAYLAVEH